MSGLTRDEAQGQLSNLEGRWASGVGLPDNNRFFDVLVASEIALAVLVGAQSFLSSKAHLTSSNGHRDVSLKRKRRQSMIVA